MDGSVSGWADGSVQKMNGSMGYWVGRLMDECGWLESEAWVGVWVDGWMGVWVGGWMGVWVGAWMDGGMNGQGENYQHGSSGGFKNLQHILGMRITFHRPCTGSQTKQTIGIASLPQNTSWAWLRIFWSGWLPPLSCIPISQPPTLPKLGYYT